MGAAVDETKKNPETEDNKNIFNHSGMRISSYNCRGYGL